MAVQRMYHKASSGETHSGREESSWLGSGYYYVQMLPSQPPLPKGFIHNLIILAISHVNKTFTMIISFYKCHYPNRSAYILM